MNTFGEIFNIQLIGASHEPEIGIAIEGCPAGIPLSVADFLPALQRRKPLREGTTPRLEDDIPEIRSGVSEGISTGNCIEVFFANQNIRPDDYKFGGFYRPGHADYVAKEKYGHTEPVAGGGIFSGRTTVALVAAGVVASKIIPDIRFAANLVEVGGSTDIEAVVKEAASEGDSLGGKIRCEITGVPVGWGEPYFDSLESLLSHAIFSIPGVKAISFGEGIHVASMKGSAVNDLYSGENGQTFTNQLGGINGGISNGNIIYFDVYVRPPASISKPQFTYNSLTQMMGEFSISGRHDVCFALRLPVVIEMLAACVIADAKLLFDMNKTGARI